MLLPIDVDWGGPLPGHRLVALGLELASGAACETPA
jgi:hypothetical protein